MNKPAEWLSDVIEEVDKRPDGYFDALKEISTLKKRLAEAEEIMPVLLEGLTNRGFHLLGIIIKAAKWIDENSTKCSKEGK